MSRPIPPPATIDALCAHLLRQLADLIAPLPLAEARALRQAVAAVGVDLSLTLVTARHAVGERARAALDRARILVERCEALLDATRDDDAAPADARAAARVALTCLRVWLRAESAPPRHDDDPREEEAT